MRAQRVRSRVVWGEAGQVGWMRPGGALWVIADFKQGVTWFSISFKEITSHRIELGLDRVIVDVRRPSYCKDPCGNDSNLDQTGGHEEMRKGKTPGHSRGLLALSPWPAWSFWPISIPTLYHERPQVQVYGWSSQLIQAPKHPPSPAPGRAAIP